MHRGFPEETNLPPTALQAALTQFIALRLDDRTDTGLTNLSDLPVLAWLSSLKIDRPSSRNEWHHANGRTR